MEFDAVSGPDQIGAIIRPLDRHLGQIPGLTFVPIALKEEVHASIMISEDARMSGFATVPGAGLPIGQ